MRITAVVNGAVAAPGVHPQAARDWDKTTQEQLIICLNQSKAVAIGEIGLDSLVDDIAAADSVPEYYA